MQELEKQYHIQCVAGDVGRYVILPGDPGRCASIAAQLDDAVHIGQNREFNIYTGWLLGEKASGAFCMSTNIAAPFADIEDHATVVLKFPHARALVEGTWATWSAGNVPSGPILYGEKGTLVADRFNNQVLLFTERHKQEPTRVYEAPSIEAGRSNLAEEFLHAVETGEMHPMLSPEINMDAMAACEAALRSCESGKLEIVP